MKYKIILFLWLLALLSSPAAMAQSLSSFTNLRVQLANVDTTNNYNGIVRAYGPEKYVVMSRTSTDSTQFTLVDNPYTCRQIVLPKGWHVKDFCIAGDEIFFCGRKGLHAIMGHLSILDFANPDTFQMAALQWRETTILNRVAAYKEAAGRLRVIAVGDLGRDYASYQGPLVCFEAYEPAIGSFNTTVGISYCITDANIAFYDVCVTDHYVGLVGIGRGYAFVSPVDKSSLPTSIPNPFPCHTYSNEPPSQKARCVALHDDYITMAYPWSDHNHNHNYEMRYFTVDLRDMSLVSAQSEPLPDRVSPSEIAYCKQLKTIVCLQENYASDPSSRLGLIEPYRQAPYPSFQYYKHQKYISSVDFSNPFHAVTFDGMLMMKDIQPGIVDQDNSCNNAVLIKLNPLMSVMGGYSVSLPGATRYSVTATDTVKSTYPILKCY